MYYIDTAILEVCELNSESVTKHWWRRDALTHKKTIAINNMSKAHEAHEKLKRNNRINIIEHHSYDNEFAVKLERVRNATFGIRVRKY